MARVSLNNTDDWKLVYDDQNVRGWEVVDRSGEVVSHVEDMIIDTEGEYVETLVLEDGQEIPARDVMLADGVVYADADLDHHHETGVAMYPHYGQVRHREHTVEGPAYGTYQDDFRRHFNETYTGGDYTTYEPAYRYGYASALDRRYGGRSYDDVEPELRTTYHTRHPGSRYDDVRDAIRYAYERARSGRH